MKDYKYISGAVRKFSSNFANAFIENPLLKGYEEAFYEAYSEDNSWVEQAYAIFVNNLVVNETGVLNYKDAEVRAAQYVRNYLDSAYIVEPVFQEWEYKLYPVNQESMDYPDKTGEIVYVDNLNGMEVKSDNGDIIRFTGEYILVYSGSASHKIKKVYFFVDFNGKKELIIYEYDDGFEFWRNVTWGKEDASYNTYIKDKSLEDMIFVHMPSKRGLVMKTGEFIDFRNESEKNRIALKKLGEIGKY